MWTLKSLSEKTLSRGSGSLTPSSQTMAFNLIANLFGDIAVTWESQIGTLPQLIPKGMVKLRQ